MGDYYIEDEEEKVESLFLVAFNTEISTDENGIPNGAEVGIESLVYICTSSDWFTHQIAPEEFPLEHNPQEIANRIQMVSRFNPQRHIRLYSIITTVDPQSFECWVEEMPSEAEKLIKEKGSLLFK